ncbi:MAG TPA: type II toxin-antitoxin system RelE/ParE family toxin [Bacteroidales bacterium]|nr:type II toxin-antitoxin system RelE/ParE family toxin [Bacteroidales bacterium]HPS15701.1 type II toxin-antitoxin system RelE/ParE family toxin [Bacteroidales bacterium]
MKIIWTHEALEETKLIYKYYKLKASLRVAKNIKNRIFSSAKNLQKQPRKGQIEELLIHKKGEYRYLVTSNYKIIYKLTEKEIYIMKVFDCRQNPEKIKS